MDKAAIVCEARQLFNDAFVSKKAGISVLPRAACLYHTVCLMMVGHRHGLNLMPQAGAAAWPRINMAHDDGVVDTHFAYEWPGIDHPDVMSRIAIGAMPEMHVWAADADSREIIDTTTRYLIDQCQLQAKLQWTADTPPDFFWGAPDALPDLWFYRPDMQAIHLIANAIKDSINRVSLVLRGFNLTISPDTDIITATREAQ